MQRTLSASGKLFLSGEYAVLWGGVARLVATGPRTWALGRAQTDRGAHVLLDEGRLSGESTVAGVRWSREVPRAFHFAAFALDWVYRATGAPMGVSVALSSSPSSPGGAKLGLGSSARAAVLTIEAARSALGASFDSLKLALLAHADAQGGKGSGADVAAIFAGGAVRYRRYGLDKLLKAGREDSLRSALPSAPPVDLLRLPAFSVPMAYAFAGESASTPSLISQVEARWLPAERDRFVLQSDVLGDALERALLKADFAQLTAAVNELRGLLKSLGPLETESMERLLRIAESCGCTGKLSGAGGGDGCVLFAPDVERRRLLLSALSERGITAMPLELEAGLRGEPRSDPELGRWLSAVA